MPFKLSSLAIAAVVLVSFFDNFSQFPIIAPYARSLGAGPGLVGVVVAVYSVTNLGGNILAGLFLDRFGRKRLLILGLVAAAGAVFLYSLASDPNQLVAIRALHGLAAAILAPAAFTLLGDIFPKEKRGRAMGAHGALIALAAMVAPAFSGVIRDRWGFEAVFSVVAGLLLATAAMAQRLVRETLRPDTSDRKGSPAILPLLRRKQLALAYAAAVSLSFGLGVLVTYLPLFLGDLGYRGAQTGISFSSFALVALLVMASPLSRAEGRWGRFGPMGFGLCFVGVSMLLMGVWPRLEAVLALMALYGLGFGLIFPAANAQVADVTLPGQRGTAFGIFYAFYSVGVVIGATASGAVAGLQGIPAFAPFLLAGVLSSLAGPILLILASSYVIQSSSRQDISQNINS